MAINRKFFFDYARINLFDGRFSPSQVKGLSLVLDEWDAHHADLDDRFLAYMLGTAHHETGRTFQPVRETYAKTDQAAASILENAWRRGRLPWVTNPYWYPDTEDKYWIGRGLVQITHKQNYSKLSELIGIDLVTDPTVAMIPAVAVRIMTRGMMAGAFTGHNLARYFNGPRGDWRGARRIINGLERADLVGSYAQRYYGALSYTV
ncbi:MAG: hypothetical protein KL863_08870 [Rhizobium sp.]|nr:hypothetical protein [Rhizobium sp.]